MEKLLSIIIPTYNMEKYLHKCLDSLIVSDENMKKLEVLVVNDGSKDSSSKIAHEYKNKFPLTFRVIDKENGNYGSCINRGLAEATGKFVKVLDADDCFDTNQFDLFMDRILNVEADLIISSFVTVREDGRKIKDFTYNFDYYTTIDINKIINNPKFRRIQMHAITYARSLFVNNPYHQSEGISYTDQEWIFTPIYYAKTAYVTDLMVYRYLLGREGQTMDTSVKLKSISHTSQGLVKMICDYTSMEFTDKNNGYFKYVIMRRMEYLYRNYLIKNFDVLPISDLLKVEKKIKEINIDIMDWSEDIGLLYGYPKYVKIWREHPNGLMISLLRKFRNIL